MSAKDTIDARPETIGALITFSSTPDTIAVPVYQRFYQWDSSKLLDILKLSDPDSRDFGFIGTMVFVQAKNNSLEIVDGQQRIISLVLILCALRDFIREYIEKCTDEDVIRKLDDMARDIQKENLLVSRSYSETSDIPRLVFHRTSYGVFKEKYLAGKLDFSPDELSSKKELNFFNDNYIKAKEYLHSKYDHHREKEITPLLNKRLVRLKGLVVNAIYITSPEYAGEVFESINGTGVTLKLSELVKNYVFRKVSTSSQQKWEQMENNCDGNTDLIVNVIKYDWQNRYDETQDFDIFRSIKANEVNVEDYLNRLLRVSKIFSFYLHPNAENFSYLKLEDNRNDKNHIIKLAAALRIIKAKEFLRLIIALDSLGDHIGINDYHKLLKSLTNFQIRAKVASTRTSDINRLYTRYGRRLQRINERIAEGSITKKEAPDTIRKILFDDLAGDLRKLSPDDAFEAGFVNFSRSKSTGKDFFKYLLSRIENKLQRSELIIDISDNQITLEEIYPQEPDPSWASTNLDFEDTYRVGNATILTGKDNGAGSNKSIAEKYPIYKSSNLILNQDLVRLVDRYGRRWNKDILAQRSQALSKIALEIWKI